MNGYEKLENRLNQFPRIGTIILSIWLLVNFAQAYFTELFHDEAYYWMYGQHLDWGYFEHAPLIGLLIRAGGLLFSGEIGVRFLPVLLGAGTVWLTWKMTDQKNPVFFFTLVFSMIMVHVGGFLAVPDSPYIFFTALFLFQYRRFLQESSLVNTLLLAGVVTLLVYSKYHGVMVLFFTLLSNWKLLRSWQFWLIVGISTLLFIPHLNWLVENDFGTFRYHLLQRPRGHFPFETFLNYLLGQVLFAGPLVGIPVLLGGVLYRAENEFERTMKFVFIGITGFLLVFSINSWIEANWAAGAYIPGMILAYQYLERSPKGKRWVWRLAVPGAFLFVFLRVYLAFNIVPELRQFRREFHGWDEWAQEIAALAKGNPVVFTDTYQLPSKYAFYTGGKTTHALNTFTYHTNSYDLWGGEDKVRGKTVLYVSGSECTGCDSLFSRYGDRFYYRTEGNFQVFRNLRIEADTVAPVWPAGYFFRMKVKIFNDYDHPIKLNDNPDIPIYLTSLFYEGKKFARFDKNTTPLQGEIAPGEYVEAYIDMTTPEKPGDYRLILTLMYDWYYASVNGSWQEVEVR
ncbi:MAG: glycosyltransferase family 39 protein [Bacteroidia bacterium]|nr:glycosyltransferase family 39 protein [Bacteroidia bacterium]